MNTSAEELVGWVAQHPGLRTRQIASGLNVAEEGLDALREALLDLERAGRVLRVPAGVSSSRGGWELADRTDFRVGVLKLTRRGQGFVRVAPGSVREEDFYVRRGGAGTAFSGDLVLIRIQTRGSERGRRAGRARGEASEGLREAVVVDVRERGRRLVRGKLSRVRGGGIVKPTGHRSDIDIFVPSDSVGDTHDGEEVLVRLVDGAASSHEKGARVGRGGGQPRGRVVVRRREEGTLRGDLDIIRELYDLREEYAPEALREAESFPEIVQGRRWPDRVDLRRERIFTIDPVDSKDFDDAVSLEPLGGGRVRLGVHIADVSHYIPAGSALDAEAAKRGTSIYLPGRTIHMLPERIAGNLASLRPCEDRLAKSVLMTFSPAGELEHHQIVRSVIRSVRRFTYEEVLAILQWIETRRATPELPPDHAAYEEVLRGMSKLRDRLHRRRRERGALDLDIPALRLEVDERGDVTGLRAEGSDPSHALIEEFMLAANETVAKHLIERDLPFLSRAHAPPEERKLDELRTYLAALGFQLGRQVDAGELQRLVDGVAHDPLSGVLELAILRTMEHAAYVVGASLHFALATETYCHFTSPIRRYPDLIVHQILDEELEGRLAKGVRRRYWAERLGNLAERTSELERRAEEAEREMIRLRLIRYLQPRIGEELNGRIASVHPFGFFVRADGLPIDGMVPVASLGDDYYEFDRERLALRGTSGPGRYGVGDRVRVVLSGADPDLREITFEVLGGAQAAVRAERGGASARTDRDDDGESKKRRRKKVRSGPPRRARPRR